MKTLFTLLASLLSASVIESSAAAAPLTLETAPTRFVTVAGTRFAYRRLGPKGGVPLLLLQHFTGTMDYWDPAVVNGLAAAREVIVFDNTGVGGSSGKVPDSVEQMAADALAFIRALDLAQVDLLGYSLGGMVAQVLAAQHPDLVRKVILANTVHQGGGNHLMQVLDQARAQKTYPDPRMVLFFTESKRSIEAGQAFLARSSARQHDRDPESGPDVAPAQAKALIVFSTTQDPAHALLSAIHQPVLIVSGSKDTMLPTEASYAMFQILPNAKLVLNPDANHGAIFQHHDAFVADASSFLDR